MLNYFIILSFSSIYGLDIGSKNIRIAEGVPGKPIELLVSSEHGRAIPNYLSFSKSSFDEKPEYSIGTRAERIYHRYKNQSIQNPFSFDYDSFSDLSPLIASSIAFSLALPDINKKRDKLIVTVPSSFSPQKRRSLVRSLSFLNISSVQILDSNTAVATLYAIEKLKKNKRQTILFVDIGDSTTELSLWEFKTVGKAINVSLKHHRIDSNIGGRNVDEEIYQYVLSKIQTDQPIFNQSVFRTIIKAKESLISGGEAKMDFLDDYQVNIPLSNQIVSEIASSTHSRFKELLEGFPVPDEIELIGGSTRLPLFLNEIQKTFPKVTVGRTMNSDEAVVFGATYFVSLQLGLIAGRKIELTKPSTFGIDLISNERVTLVYRANDTIERKSVSLRKFKDFDFDLKNNLNETYTVKVINISSITENITQRLSSGSRPYVQLNFGKSQQLDCSDFISASLHANITVNVSVGNESFIDDNKATSWSLKTEIAENLSDNPSYLYEYLELDEKRKRHANAVGQFETFIIDLTDKIEYDPDFQIVASDDERNEVKSILARERQGIEASGTRVSALDIERRFEKMKSQISQVLTRYEEYKIRPAMIAKLNATIQKTEKQIQNRKYDEEQMKKINEHLDKIREKIEQASLIQPTDNPAILSSELKFIEENLLKKVGEIAHQARQSGNSISFKNDPNDPDYEKNLKKLKAMGINIATPTPGANPPERIPERPDESRDTPSSETSGEASGRPTSEPIPTPPSGEL